MTQTMLPLSKSKVDLKVTPPKTLMDETLAITASNLERGQKVAIVAIIINEEDDSAFYSYAELQADESGFLDVGHSFSFKGTYIGIEPMGLFWSATPAPGQKKGLRLIKRVLQTPLKWRIFLIEGSLSAIDQEDESIIKKLVSLVRSNLKNAIAGVDREDHPDQSTSYKLPNKNGSTKMDCEQNDPKETNIPILAEALAERYYSYSSDVEEIPIRDGRVRGMLFVPKFLRTNENVIKHETTDNKKFDGELPRMGIIDVYGGGLFKNYRAILLAQRGFIVLGLAYCGYDDLPKYIDTDVDYLLDSANFLLSDRCPERVDKERGLGVIGLCKGATLVLEMAVYHKGIKAVVAINAPCFNEIGCFRRPGSFENVAREWTINDPLLKRTEEGLVSGGLFEWFDRKSEEEKQTIGIAVEKIEPAQILFIYGEDDVSVGARNLDYMVRRLKSAGKSNYRCLVYPKSGHMIDPPIFPHCRSSYWPLFKDIFVWGGETKSHHHAQLDSWHQILNFFRSHLVGNNT